MGCNSSQEVAPVVVDDITTDEKVEKVEEKVEKKVVKKVKKKDYPDTGNAYWAPDVEDADMLPGGWPDVCDHQDDQEYKEYVERRKKFQLEAQDLHSKTKKLERLPIPSDIQYVRPFLSSTFRDFNEERNILMQRAFPPIEKLCNERNLFFAPLDLRWGVTSEQSNTGQVIKICLDEIDRSRPFFVCSLGFRNGWALSPYQDDWNGLLEHTFQVGAAAYPWVADRKDRGVTELEIMHGALNDPTANPRCFFYFRDANLLETYDKEARKTFCEPGLGEKRLQRLKTNIIKAGFEVKWFKNPEHMCELLKADLEACIELDFPIRVVSQLERELKDHQAFAEIRTRCYVGYQDQMEHCNEYLFNRDNAQPICVSGKSGSGKSSFLANFVNQMKRKMKNSALPGKRWVLKKIRRKNKRAGQLTVYTDEQKEERSRAALTGTELELKQKESPEDVIQVQEMVGETKSKTMNWNVGCIIERYIGSTSDSTQPLALMRSMCEQLIEEFQMDDKTLPNDLEDMVDTFSELLQNACAERPVLIVLDGLDQIEKTQNAHGLKWFPKDVPKKCKLLVSSESDAQTYVEVMKRGFDDMSIPDLSNEECEELTHKFLDMFGKKLDKGQLAIIMGNIRTRVPLYLITFLQEVRTFGSYEQLNDRIELYMSASTIPEMFDRVITRLEEDFEKKETGEIVRHTLSLMFVSRRGLNEKEIRGCLERIMQTDKKNPFPNLEFASMMLRLDASLVNLRGLRAFGHAYLFRAVKARYFTEASVELDYRHTLVKYFQSHDEISNRVIEELPFHQQQMLRFLDENGEKDSNMTARLTFTVDHCLNSLTKTISGLDMFNVLKSMIFKYDLHQYWLTVEKMTNDSEIAAKRYDLNIEVLRNDGADPVELAEVCEDVSTFLISTDRYKGAERPLDMALRLKIKAFGETDMQVQSIIAKKANLLERLGNHSAALPLYQKALSIVKKNDGGTGDLALRTSVLETSIAGLLKAQGRYEESLPLYQKSLQDKIRIKGDSDPVVAVSMSNLAELFLRMKKPQKALTLYKDSLKILEDFRGPDHPEVATVLSSLASAYMQLEENEHALKLYDRARDIKGKLLGTSHVSMGVLLNNLAAVYHNLKDNDRAIELYEESLAIREKAYGKDEPMLIPTLNNMGLVSVAAGDFEQAEQCFRRSLAIAQGAKGKGVRAMMIAYQQLASLAFEKKEMAESLELYEKQLTMVQKRYGENSVQAAKVYDNIAAVYQAQGKINDAAQYLNLELEIYRRKEGAKGLSVADVLFSLGVLMQADPEREPESLEYLEKCLAIRTAKLGEKHADTRDVQEWIRDLGDNFTDEEEDSDDSLDSDDPELLYARQTQLSAREQEEKKLAF